MDNNTDLTERRNNIKGDFRVTVIDTRPKPEKDKGYMILDSGILDAARLA